MSATVCQRRRGTASPKTRRWSSGLDYLGGPRCTPSSARTTGGFHPCVRTREEDALVAVAPPDPVVHRLRRRDDLDDFPFPPSLADLVPFDDDPRTHFRLHGDLLQANRRLRRDPIPGLRTRFGREQPLPASSLLDHRPSSRLRRRMLDGTTQRRLAIAGAGCLTGR